MNSLWIALPAPKHVPVVARRLAHLLMAPLQPHAALGLVQLAQAWLEHVLIVVVVGLDARGRSMDRQREVEGRELLGGVQEAFGMDDAKERGVEGGVRGGIAELA